MTTLELLEFKFEEHTGISKGFAFKLCEGETELNPIYGLIYKTNCKCGWNFKRITYTGILMDYMAEASHLPYNLVNGNSIRSKGNVVIGL